jgi:hypothetical protein
MTKKTLIPILVLLTATLGACGEDDGADAGGGEPTGAGASPTSGAPEGAAGSGGGGTVSIGAPAMCSSGDDCPEGVECVLPAGGSVGFCNVDEMQASGGPSDGATPGADGMAVTLGMPAPCMSDAECGDATCVRPFDDEPGHCDVEEMQAQP